MQQKVTNTPEQNKGKPELLSSTEQIDVAKASPSFPILNVKDYDFAKKTIHYIQVNLVIEKPGLKSHTGKKI